MTGVCGWLGYAEQNNPSGVLCTMLGFLGDPQPQATAGREYAAGAYSPFALASCYDADGLIAAIDGQVRWHDAELSGLAKLHSPAFALHTAYRRWGKDCVKHLHNSFALAVMEPATRTVLLAIDRLGIHRLCFAPYTGGIVFGSSCNSVTAHPAIGSRIHAQGIFNFLYHHMVPSPGTIFSGVEKLLPAQYLLYQDGRITRGFYWEAAWDAPAPTSFEQSRDTLKLLLSESVRSALDKSATGTFLSGGTDSSTVAGILTQVSGRPAETFSIGFEAEGFDEMEYARIAAKQFGTHAHEYYVTPDDVVTAIPLIAAGYDEPFGNASAVPTYFCAQKAKEAGINIMLAGDGGDEIFGGNKRYATQKVFEAYRYLPEGLRRGLIEPVTARLPNLPLLRKIASYVRQARVPLPDRMEAYNFLHKVALDTIFDREFLREVDPEAPLRTMRDSYHRTRSREIINCMLHLDWKQTLADNDLRKVNRMCELAGVEVRYPLLDERMVEFAAQLPVNYKVRRQQLRWFFKEALRGFLPDEIIHKSKHGFGLPFGLWMQRHPPLHDLATQSLRAFRSRNILRPEYLDELTHLHQTGHASYYGAMIWVVMMLEQWLSTNKH